MGRATRGEGRAGGGKDRLGRGSMPVLSLVVRAVPMGLAEGVELASAALVLASVVPRDALGVDGDRGRLGDERRLATFGADPAGQGVVLGQMQAYLGAAEDWELVVYGPDLIGVRGHHEIGGRTSVLS